MFEIYQSEKTKKFHYRLKAANGQIILSGQAYKDKASCANGVESVLKNGADENRYEIKESTDGRKYFVLKSSNGQIIGQSQMYKSESGLKNGIMSVGNNIADSRLKDLC
ncbi:MAG: YegP family protein [Akkermansiaceae bacterium]